MLVELVSGKKKYIYFFLFCRIKPNDMATSVEKMSFVYFIITNENDQKEVERFAHNNFSVMEDLLFDWLVFVRRDENWVGHCLMKRAVHKSLRRQLHRLMVYNVAHVSREQVMRSLQNHFRGSSMNIRVQPVSEQDFFTPDDPDIEWALKKSLYSPSFAANPTTLGRPLAEKAREVLRMENML